MVHASSPASEAQVSPSTAATVTGRIRGRFGAYVLPFLLSATVAVGTPLPVTTRRYYSGGEGSSSEIGYGLWLLDDFAYTEEAATMAQVSALNALLALPAVEGFRLDLPE